MRLQGSEDCAEERRPSTSICMQKDWIPGHFGAEGGQRAVLVQFEGEGDRRESMAEKAEAQAQQPSGTGVSSLERAVSAFVGYSCGAVVVLPFDRVKSLLQVSCQRAATV